MAEFEFVSDTLLTEELENSDGTETIAGSALTVSTDKDDYAPGATATITADGLEQGDTVTFEVDHVSDPGDDGTYGTADDEVVELGGDGHDSWTVTDGGEGDLDGEANGTIVTEWYVNPDDSLDETFILSATTDDGEAAYVSFTDGLVGSNLDLTTANEFHIDPNTNVVFSNIYSGSGSGVYNSFVRIGSNQAETEGHNYDRSGGVTAVNDEDNSPTFNFVIQLQDIPVVYKDGVAFIQFSLDINEEGSLPNNFLSLDELKIVTSDSSGLTSIDGVNWLGGAFNQAYDLNVDSGIDYILLDYNNAPGSGESDLLVEIPLSLFSGVADTDYVYLWSAFGGYEAVDPINNVGYGAGAGFEEWATINFPQLSGFKFLDLDVDGQYDSGTETPLADFSIYVYIDADGDGVLDQAEYDAGWFAKDVTDVNGEYTIFLDPDAIEAGQNFIVVEGVKAGYDQSAPFGTSYNGYDVNDVIPDALVMSGGDDLHPILEDFGYVIADSDVDFGSNNDLPDADFGNFEPFGTITGEKYEDVAGDGIGGTDTPVAGWTIYLFDTSINTDGIAGLSDAEIAAAISGATPVATTTTVAPNGAYTFENVLAGDYYIVEDPDGPDGSWAPSTQSWHLVTVTGGETYGDEGGEVTDFYNFQPAEITGVKYEDLNADGIENGDDASNPIGGITINLYQDTNENGVLEGTEGDLPFMSTTTDATDGTWSFSGLLPGFYIVEEVLSGGYASADDTQFDVELSSGETYGVNADTTFLNYRPGSISGIKYHDKSKDGARQVDGVDGIANNDDDEVGLAGWQIFIDANDNGVLDWTDAGSMNGEWDEGEGERWTTTDSDGLWSFEELEPGDYIIREVMQDGWTQSDPGGNGAILVNVQSGEDDGGHEFGNHELNPGTAQTPGFWKNHCKILEDEVGFDPKSTFYEDIFGVDVTNAGEVDKGKDKYSADPSFKEALGALGGDEGALLRASSAAYANAASDDVDYIYDSYNPYNEGETPTSLQIGVAEAMGHDFAAINAALAEDPADTTLLDAFNADYDFVFGVLDTVDDDGDRSLSPEEIIDAVQDLYGEGTSTDTDFDFDGTGGQYDVNELASALDAMNNMPHIDVSEFT